MDKKDRLILVTNDDGYQSKGIAELVKLANEFGNVIVVAPAEVQSGTSHSVSLRTPLYVNKFEHGFYCSGKPSDCVKIAIHELLDRKPDLVLSGINHGENTSVSAIYSGTIGAAREATINGIASIGLSLADFREDADFTAAVHYARIIIKTALDNNIAPNFCLNVNIPSVPMEEINGIKVCRQTRGKWQEVFEYQKDIDAYFLKGEFVSAEPAANDTDDWAVKNNYVSVVPVNTDVTEFEVLNDLQKWGL